MANNAINEIILLSKDIESIEHEISENHELIEALKVKNARLLVEKEKKFNEINKIYGKMIHNEL